MSTKQAWLGFWILALIWGSSYFFIRIGVEELPPFQLVFVRTGIAAIGLIVIATLRGKRLPTDRRSIVDLLFLGIVNTVFPFALITWGETHIESGLASVLQGTTPLFSLVIAHFAFVDERITVRKVIGLAVGFFGVLLLASRSGSQEVTSSESTLHLMGQAAIMVSSLCYAIGGAYSRKAMQNRLEPIIVSAGAMIVASVITGAITFLVPLWGGPVPVALSTLSPRVLGAVVTLGLLNTFVAYLIFYSLIAALGASRTSMITYILPAIGLVLGAIFLNEVVDWRLIAGALLIIGSIGIVNLNFQTLRRSFTKTPAAASTS